MKTWLAIFLASFGCLHAAGVRLAWDPSQSPDVIGYVLRWGHTSAVYNASNIYHGPVTNCSISNLIAGTNYYFVVTAYNADGIESDFSNEVMYNSEHDRFLYLKRRRPVVRVKMGK